MIQSLYIQNYALIEDLKVQWGAHLNIITGETGSGKSILLGALGLILGDRADISILTDKLKKCIVEASFQIEKTQYIPFFEKHELDLDSIVIIRREITPQGKSRAFINDTPVNLQVLRSLTSQLVDLHLQNETQELNGPAFHLSIVDTIAGTESDLAAYKQAYILLKQTEKKLQELQNLQQQAVLEKDYKTFLLNELLEAKPDPEEYETLEQEAEKLEHAEKITEQATQALQLLAESDSNILDGLNTVKALYMQAGKHDPTLANLANRISEVIIELKDIADETTHETSKIVYNPDRLLSVNDRIKTIHSLIQKHRVKSVEELNTLMTQLDNEVMKMQSLDDEIAKAEAQAETLRSNILQQADILSNRRQKVFQAVEKGINSLLPEAGLEKARIKIDHQKKQIGNDGSDDIQFLFSANTGSEFIPLHKTASGGELSRFMLCIKTYIAGKTELPTLIFDEIDTGISGQVAIKIGRLMKTLAQKHQVIAVTHLPQIAGKADMHFKLYKEEDSGKTYSKIKALNGEARLTELAEMLGGASYSEKTLQAAVELLEN